MEEIPEYPITVIFHEDNTEWVLYNEVEIVNNLEWFDSQDPEEYATVIDNQGRLVRLIVQQLEIISFELA